ncbi:hypothetical protein EYR36_003995 [Pleurotus pulmonarius]|nr:hypothetical protein EYR36_003995 [Pleurotus pulmonarius]
MTTSTPSPAQDAAEALRTDFVGFASFAVLIWDHLISLEDEVQFVWKGKKGPIVYLFFLNRYFTPLAFIINLYAYLSPSWTIEVILHFNTFIRAYLLMTRCFFAPQRCERFIRYEGTTVAFAVEVVGLMMSLRIRALYPHQPFIAYFLWFLLTVETGLNAWLISGGRAVPHNPDSGVHFLTIMIIAAPPDRSQLRLQVSKTSLLSKGHAFIHVFTPADIGSTSTNRLEQLKAGRLTGTEVLTNGQNDIPFFNRRHRWDRDIFIETHVDTHVSQPSPSEETPTTPSDAVLRSTDIRFKVPTTPDSVALDDPFVNGRDAYEMADFRTRAHRL